MSLMCMLGKHSFGPLRVDAAGATVMECLVCLKVQPARVSLQASPESSTTLDDRRAQAIAELIATKRWAGLPTAPNDRGKS